jgi:alkyldihydroxyacetonephosphate synthase
VTFPISFNDEPESVRLNASFVELTASQLKDLEKIVRLKTSISELNEGSRDWWPISLRWARDKILPAKLSAIAVPKTESEVSEVISYCNKNAIPVTPAGQRSGVCGAAIPLFGGISLEFSELKGLKSINKESNFATFYSGTNGAHLEKILNENRKTLGHFPQSIDISTLGGWLSCASAGQFSTKYGKIEDMTMSLKVALADGQIIKTGSENPGVSLGPDLKRLFIGSEGCLGLILEATLVIHDKLDSCYKSTLLFDSFSAGISLCKNIIQDGFKPCVLRLYDEAEAKRNFQIDSPCLLIYDEANDFQLSGFYSYMESIIERKGPTTAVDKWLTDRNDVSALGKLIELGFVIDTIEISVTWDKASLLYDEVTNALNELPETVNASCHLSHAYQNGACLYFTFAGKTKDDSLSSYESYYFKAWDTVLRVCEKLDAGASHHHGPGLLRARFVQNNNLLSQMKTVFDPNGILNPGKLNLAHNWGDWKL